jgi:aspartate-semialdehyde dehydrogenase
MRLAVCGAEGLEGERLITALDESELTIDSLLAVVADSDAEIPLFRGRPVASVEAGEFDSASVDLVIFLKGDASGYDLVDRAIDAGLYVIDASGNLAQQDDVPLCGSDLSSVDGALSVGEKVFAIADPVSSQVAALVAHFPPAARIDLAVQQPVSAMGRRGVEVLAAETARLLNGMPVEESEFGLQLAFNCMNDAPAAGEIEHSLTRLLTNNGMAPDVFCNVATVPVFYGHSVAIAVECVAPPSVAAALENITDDSRFKVVSAGDSDLTPTALADADTINIGDIHLGRRSLSHICATLVGDNLRKGVVINIIALLKILIKSDS